MPHVLIVDDDLDSLTIIGMMLKRAGFSVSKAQTGEQALACVEIESLPDVMLLDTILPDMDGYEVCRQIHAAHPTLPIIFFTARTEYAAVETAKRAGASDYLVKPTSATQLIASIQKHLAVDPTDG